MESKAVFFRGSFVALVFQIASEVWSFGWVFGVQSNLLMFGVWRARVVDSIDKFMEKYMINELNG